MKKLKKSAIAVFSCILIIFTLFNAHASTPGDVTNNGKLEASDARCALRYSVELDIPTETQFEAADINNDGKITASDARTILRVSVELEPYSYSDINIWATEATSGNSSNEEASNLFDLDAETKWCVTRFKGCYVLFETDTPVAIKGYTMVTGEDSFTYRGRNPKKWTLFASNDKENWVTLDSKSDYYGMPDKNKEKCYFGVDDVYSEYQYFLLEIYECINKSCMQLTEFSLDYYGADYKYKNMPNSSSSSGSSGSSGTSDGAASSPVDGRFIGSKYISDGAQYTYEVGEYITFYNPKHPASTLYAYSWYIIDGAENVKINRNDATCQIQGVKEGTCTVEAYLDYTIAGYGFFDNYSYKTTFTINITPATAQGSVDQGNVSNGACPRCMGLKTVQCSGCYGDGKLSDNSPCSCGNGRVPCPFCNGTGKWS